jgi:hypothetical protein
MLNSEKTKIGGAPGVATPVIQRSVNDNQALTTAIWTMLVSSSTVA